MKRSSRQKVDKERNNPAAFINSDPTDLYLDTSTTPGAGQGLITGRKFLFGEFVLNYRGQIRNTADTDILEDSVYCFDVGGPENVTIDATETETCLARFINDVEFHHKHNVHPRKMTFDKNVVISFFARQEIPAKTELRYDYGSKMDRPWQKEEYFLDFQTKEGSTRSSKFKSKKTPVLQSAVAVENASCNKETEEKEHEIRRWRGRQLS